MQRGRKPTWPSEAAATGSGERTVKTCCGGRPHAASIVSRACTMQLGSIPLCLPFSYFPSVFRGCTTYTLFPFLKLRGCTDWIKAHLNERGLKPANISPSALIGSLLWNEGLIQTLRYILRDTRIQPQPAFGDLNKCDVHANQLAISSRRHSALIIDAQGHVIDNADH